jgi:hypothetical protein
MLSMEPTPSRPPPFRGRGRGGIAEVPTPATAPLRRLNLLPLPLKGGGWEGVTSALPVDKFQ